ncbi:conserved hypothetical protein [Talaromyces stipitatus ATCC 10500]|uniref:Uncharacterized protein n=1 Tax=Talaromyces stipitatus (strain ATCC 10500 / CBS 375.48 / QM 6759 / NRRL 1006) TaxID=441959 RepID=B8M9Y4_TALSN|nr:uncharacterized protein TSTA_119000 [Talaromyces stipitatus ATCC 10500]EED18136.1 conserved hypothetical protein [Talaromyces stipitatus ATCC 10500]
MPIDETTRLLRRSSELGTPQVENGYIHNKASSNLKGIFGVLRPGFTKKYNFWLFSIFGFFMAFFCFARLKYLSTSVLEAELTPGDWFWFHDGILHIGFMLHLATMLPAGLLMILQFVPRIRYKFMLFHRLNGYVVIILALIGNVTAMIIARRAFGGDMGSQTCTGFLALASTVAMALAWWNIRCLQIDLHRAWMLRAMFWMGSIVSTRAIMPLMSIVQTALGGYFIAWPCDEIIFILGNREDLVMSQFPQCLIPNGTTSGWVAVEGDLDFSNPVGLGAIFNTNFGAGLWLALILHMIGVEIYLALTPIESERLRKVSYERQLAAGYENPGNCGTTVSKWGDIGSNATA